MSYKHIRINSPKCDLSVRFINIAKIYGFKTLGSFEKFLLSCEPNAKLYFYSSHNRVVRLLNELNRFKGELQQKSKI